MTAADITDTINTTVTNWAVLPFQNYDMEEINELLASHKQEKNNEKNYPHLLDMELAEQLPFRQCTNIELISMCMSNIDSFLRLLENNNLSNDIIRQASHLHYNFNCSYQNEISFKKVINNHTLNSLKVFHLNIRSLNKYKLILKSYLEDLKCNFDLIFLSETGNVIVNEIEEVFDHYKFYYDAPSQKRGSKGGSGILINKESFDKIEEILIDDNLKGKCTCSNCIIENKWIKLSSLKDTYILGSIYRHPNGNITHFTESLNCVLDKIDKNATCIIAGDINIDLMKQTNSSKLYLETLMAHNILPYICIPTRLTDNSATIIDHINVRLPKNKIHTKISAGNLKKDISDHFPNYFIMDLEINKTKDRPLIRLYNEKNIKNFNRNLPNEPPLLPHPRSNDPNILLAEFIHNLQRLLDKYFPLIRISRKKYKEKIYINDVIKSMIKNRNDLYDIFINNRTETNKENWRIMRNRTNQAIRNAEIEYYKVLINEHGKNCNAMWKTLNHIISNKKKRHFPINSLTINQKQLNNQQDIAEGLNDFFCNIGESLAKQHAKVNDRDFLKYLDTPVDQSMYMYRISENEISNQIKHLDSKKSAGHDGITAKFLKLSLPFVVNPLTEIFNTSINTGIYPDTLKIAKCIPLFKKGKTDDPSNYRPISILCSINKIFEKLLYKRLYKYFSKFKILYEYQYGFRQNHSTIQALIEITDYLKSSIDNKEHVCGIFLDLTKAFDTVDHQILLYKLNNYGVRGIANKLIRSYLTNRCQYVEINKIQSSKKSINYGVPQGSVLGPLLFLIYINDIGRCSQVGKLRIFADDTSGFVAGKNIDEIIANSEILMGNINNWLKSNKLTLSANKSNFVIFRSSHSRLDRIPSTLNFGENSIKRVNSVKYLGITLEEHLNWSEHVENVCNSLKKCFGTFYNIRDYLNKDQIRTIYYSLVYSKITYALAVYGLTTNENVQQIQRLQSKLLKVLTKKPYLYPTTSLHNDLKVFLRG